MKQEPYASRFNAARAYVLRTGKECQKINIIVSVQIPFEYLYR